VAEPYNNNDTGFDLYQEDVLRGRATADISHAGEAWPEDTAEEVRENLLDSLRAHHKYVSLFLVFLIENLLILATSKLFGRWCDFRTRSDWTQKRVNVFAAQMTSMTDAYMEWSSDTAEDGLGKLYAHPEGAVIEGTQRVYVVDIFSEYCLCFFFPSSSNEDL
jgi:hypothetical protein